MPLKPDVADLLQGTALKSQLQRAEQLERTAQSDPEKGWGAGRPPTPGMPDPLIYDQGPTAEPFVGPLPLPLPPEPPSYSSATAAPRPPDLLREDDGACVLPQPDRVGQLVQQILEWHSKNTERITVPWAKQRLASLGLSMQSFPEPTQEEIKSRALGCATDLDFLQASVTLLLTQKRLWSGGAAAQQTLLWAWFRAVWETAEALHVDLIVSN